MRNYLILHSKVPWKRNNAKSQNIIFDYFNNYVGNFIEKTDVQTAPGSYFKEKVSLRSQLVKKNIFQLSDGENPQRKNFKKTLNLHKAEDHSAFLSNMKAVLWYLNLQIK